MLGIRQRDFSWLSRDPRVCKRFFGCVAFKWVDFDESEEEGTGKRGEMGRTVPMGSLKLGEVFSLGVAFLVEWMFADNHDIHEDADTPYVHVLCVTAGVATLLYW